MIARDSITIVLMLLVNVLAFIHGRRLLRVYLCDLDVWSLVAGQIVLIWSAISGITFALNAIGCLSPWFVYAGVALLGFCPISLYRKKLRLTSSLEGRNENVKSQNTTGASAYGSDENVRSLADSRFEKAFRTAKQIDWFVIGMTLLATLGIAQVALFGIAQFPTDWDTLAYHLPIVDHWIQTGQLGNQRCAFWYVPGNSELLAYWFTAPLSGDFWAQLNNLPVAVLLVFSLIALSDVWEFDRKWQFVLVVLAVGCQPMIRQLSSLENDLGVAALFISSLLFGIRWVNGRQPLDLCLFMASVGLLAGIKYYALGYAAVSIGAIVATSWLLHGLRIAIRSGVGALVGCIVFGGYWYLRNYMLTGSPLFPLGMEAIGIPDQWASMRPESETSTLLRGSTPEIWGLLLRAWFFQAGPITLFAVLLSPLFAVISTIWFLKRIRAIFSLRSKVRHEKGQICGGVEAAPTIVLSLAIIGCLAVYVVTPNVIETDSGSRNMLRMQYHSVRFGYCLGLVSLLFLVKSLNWFDSWLREKKQSHLANALVGSICFLSIATLTFYLLPQYGWRQHVNRLGLPFFRQPRLDYSNVVWGLLTIDVFLVLFVANFVLKTTRSRIIGIGFLFAFCTPWLSQYWHQNYEAFYSVLSQKSLPIRLRELSGEQPFCICEYRYYPSLGSDRSGQAYRPLFLPTAESFQDYLASNQIANVAVPHHDNHWSKAYAKPLEWIREWPDLYRKKEEVDGFSIYESIEKRGAKE